MSEHPAENDAGIRWSHCRWFDPHPPIPKPGSCRPLVASTGRMGAECETCGEALHGRVIPSGSTDSEGGTMSGEWEACPLHASQNLADGPCRECAVQSAHPDPTPNPYRTDAVRARNCLTCNGWAPVSGVRRRETVGMVCPTCGWDYAVNGEPTVIPPGSTDSEGER